MLRKGWKLNVLNHIGVSLFRGGFGTGFGVQIKPLKAFVLCLMLAFAFPVLAEDEETEEGEESVAPAPAIYIPLDPQFVVNYGGAGRLKFLKTQVTLRLADSNAASAVRHHLPFIRNNLVMLFAAQTDETLESQDGREAMRAAALAEVRDLLVREEEIVPESVVDVLFNALTWH